MKSTKKENNSVAEIQYLKDYPQYLPIIAYWNYREWHVGKLPLDEIIVRYQKRMQIAAIPTTLIAIEDTMPVGSVSLKYDDLPARPNLNPWLASLIVSADYRGKGIGGALVKAAETTAVTAGVKRLYLFTHTANALYEGAGWSLLEVVETNAAEISMSESIYYKDLQ